ncbi:hypothetical protein DL89DRAFT_92600 [Linderina pennispora]|uniref:Pentacotripeptide-repeat region of PRORP domain-containing protein n=1 Tax=Linderina pennispora TaxID=61395 RepID=A0A1Y1VX21_9FUNG|nr:uncharacterized protein DL89DRAFT_92600 [Linderina pennispora]ORX65822.1 hypothetical protein DL89DRAFT_92600 [Linderina pennispora]
MLAAPRFGASGLRRTYISRQSVVIAESYLRHRRRGAASSVLQQSSALATDRQTGQTRTARQIVDLVQRGFSEPPLITKREEKYSQEEIEFAIFRLRRKLRRFLLHRRTAMKLEAMWELYVEIKRMSDWRINAEQLDQFLRAILRNGERTEWCSRAEQLLVELSERTEEADPAIYMSLLRVYAKFGDIQRFEHAAKTAKVKFGPAWTAEQSDFVETRVVAYSRAGMPAQGEQIMEDAFGATGQPVRALRELLLSWTRSKDVDRAWAKMSELLKIGMGKGTREWNALLHMHAVDLRYRYELVEQVLGRMRKAGAECDQVTYNIMMHACLLRGKQVLWKDWHKRMEKAGYAPDVYTYTALVSQLVNNGQWGEALSIIKHMRTSNIQPTAATSVAVMSMERKRGHARNIMGKFRQSVLKGASISVNEFTSVMSTALENPRQWATEIALIIRCLEEGLVGESAVVDALAARLPGLNSSRLSSRPLVNLLHQDAVAVGAVIEEGAPERQQRATDCGWQQA